MKILISLILFFSTNLALAEDFRQQSESLVGLRLELESIKRSQDDENRNAKADLESLTQRKRELGQSLSKERVRTAQLKAKLEFLKQSGQKSTALTKTEKELITTWIKDLESWTEQGLDFQKTPRLNALDKIRKDLADAVAFESLVYQLTNFTEKEIKLTQSTSYEIVDLDLNENKTKAEIVRLGLFHALFRTPNGERGYSQKSKWVLAKNSSEIEAIDRILDKSKNQAVKGYFEIPGLDNGVAK